MLRALKKISASLLACALFSSPVWAQQTTPLQPLTPAQTAFVKAETKKANDAFVKQVAKELAISEAVVIRALPDERRITDRIARLNSALEKDLKRPLTEDEKTAILAAEDARRKAISAAQQSAPRK